MTGVRGTIARLPRTTTLVGLGATGALAFGSGMLSWTCPFHLVTGWDCPGCGGVRMLADLLRGDVAAALQHNAFLLLVGLPVTVAFLTGFARVEAGRTAASWPPGWSGRALGWGLLALTLGWAVLRNLPLAPFTWLASES